MRLRFTFLTLGCANADENKKFVHKDSFMNKSTPEWWGNHSAEKRAKTYFQNALPKFLSTWNIDSDVLAWESKMRALYRTQLNLRFLIDEGKCGKEVMPAEITGNDERRRRSVLNALLDRENIDLDPLEESDQIDTQRKIKGEILSDDLDKIFQNMARYVLEEVLKAQNGKRCNKIGYKMLYRIERLRLNSMWMYCRKADFQVYPEDDMCGTDAKWRVSKNGSRTPHPNRNEKMTQYKWNNEKWVNGDIIKT